MRGQHVADEAEDAAQHREAADGGYGTEKGHRAAVYWKSDAAGSGAAPAPLGGRRVWLRIIVDLTENG
jgi:hypothetical protein